MIKSKGALDSDVDVVPVTVMEPKWADGVRTNLCDADIILIGSKVVEIMKTICTTLFEKESIKMLRMLDFPDSVAERPQRESLIRDTAVSVDSEIPSTSKGFTPQFEPEPVTTKKIKFKDLRSDDDYLRGTPGPGDKVGEDELTMIFGNTWLSAQDLLNFRLVSKRWRDAATTTLRRRDACVVELWADSDSHSICVRKRIGKLKDEDKLIVSQLTELISNSPTFPATDFRIHMSFTPYARSPHLLNFFKMHGDKIKTLRHCGRITSRCILDLLQIYAPTLEGLDLSEAALLESDEEDGGEGNALSWTSKHALLKSVNFGPFVNFCKLRKPELFPLLLSSLSKLSCLENVTLDTLQMFLKEGKTHLIRSFKYDFQDGHWVLASQLAFISLNPKPKLTKITLDLRRQCPSSATISNSLNEFIESFKDTVQILKIYCRFHQHAWEPLLSIPPMKNLKSFTLKLWTGCGGHVAPYCPLCQAEESKIFIRIRGTFFQFQDQVPAGKYFPSLMEVHLDSNFSQFNQVSPMSFFAFNSHTDHADGSAAQSGSFPKVDVLEINRIDVGSRYRHVGTRHFPSETSLVAEVFPNIRICKFKCGEVGKFSNALWALCPNVEFIEISGIESCSSFGREVKMTSFVDKVFTGFSERMLRRLRLSTAGTLCEADDLENLKFDPRISDLRRLRELKLKFVGKWSTEFASSVTGVHAFSKMETTKFILSYDPDNIPYGFNGAKAIARRNKIDAANGSVENRDDKIAKYEEFIFGPLKPYVHIVHERQKYDMWVD